MRSPSGEPGRAGAAERPDAGDGPHGGDGPDAHDPWREDRALAALLAADAGRLLVALRAERTPTDGSPLHVDDARRLRDDGDAASHRFLADALARERPDDAVLSEEAADDAARLSARRVWVVDPLDGTREYGEPPRGDWAVHVALWDARADTVVAGAVALPAQEDVLSSDGSALGGAARGPGGGEARGPGGGGARGPEGVDARLRLVVSRTRAPRLLVRLAERLGADLLPLGSAGAKTMAVVRGDADAYVHDGGQYEWDNAAPVAVARAAGLHCSRLDGAPLRWNQPDPWSPELLVCVPGLAEPLLAAVAALRG